MEKKRVLFLCHGNICRSAAAEAIFSYLAKQKGLSNLFEIDSAGVSDEEEGNSMYFPMKGELSMRGIPIPPHRAREVTRSDMEHFDIILYMDESNKTLLTYAGLFNNKCRKMTFLNPEFSEIEDPWYTRRFKKVVDELLVCCESLLDYLVD